MWQLCFTCFWRRPFFLLLFKRSNKWTLQSSAAAPPTEAMEHVWNPSSTISSLTVGPLMRDQSFWDASGERYLLLQHFSSISFLPSPWIWTSQQWLLLFKRQHFSRHSLLSASTVPISELLVQVLHSYLTTVKIIWQGFFTLTVLRVGRTAMFSLYTCTTGDQNSQQQEETQWLPFGYFYSTRSLPFRLVCMCSWINKLPQAKFFFGGKLDNFREVSRCGVGWGHESQR